MRAAWVGVALALVACAKGEKEKGQDEPAVKPLIAAAIPGSGSGPGSTQITPEVAPPPAQPPGTWEPVGKAGDWKGTRLAVVLGDHMFSLEKGDGRIWDTTLATGSWAAIGKSDFDRTTNLFAAGGKLYSIESDGSMYRIEPSTGAWETVGKPAAWKGTRLAAALGEYIYSLEKGDGRLWKTFVATGDYTVIGKPDFGRTTRIMASATWLYTLEEDGSMYRVDPSTAEWERIGNEGAWKATRLATILGDSMYSIERGDGRLWKTSLATGDYAVVGKAEFGRSRRLLATSNLLYTIEDDGSLYRIYP